MKEEINQHCSKCGHNSAKFYYIGHTIITDSADTMSGRRVSAIVIESNDEYIVLTCERCGYEWVEKPIDNKEET